MGSVCLYQSQHSTIRSYIFHGKYVPGIILMIPWIFALNYAGLMDRNNISPDFSLPSSHHNGTNNNGSSKPSEPLYEDSTLSALMKQAEQLSEIESSIQDLATACGNIRRSLATLVPAIEVHMHGLQSEARRWKHASLQAEEKYQKAFADLETRMDSLTDHLDSTETRLQQQHQQELSRLREEAATLRKALAHVKDVSRNRVASPFPEKKATDDQDKNVFDL